MLKNNSFTYTMCSTSLTNRVAGFAEGVFTFDALPQGEYFVQCTNFVLTQTGLVNAPYIINLIATDFTSERTYNAGSTLRSNQLCIASITNLVNNGTCLHSGEGSVFKVAYMDMQKRVTFTLSGNELHTRLTDVQAPWANAIWVATFQFTPI